MSIRMIADQSQALAPTGRSRVIGNIGRAVASNRKAMAGGIVLIVFLLVAILAPLIAPYDPHALAFEEAHADTRLFRLHLPENALDLGLIEWYRTDA